MFDISTPAAFLSILVFLPAVVALFIAIAAASRRPGQVDFLGAIGVMFLMSLAMIFGWSQVQFATATAGMQNSSPSIGFPRSASTT